MKGSIDQVNTFCYNLLEQFLGESEDLPLSWEPFFFGVNGFGAFRSAKLFVNIGGNGIALRLSRTSKKIPWIEEAGNDPTPCSNSSTTVAVKLTISELTVLPFKRFLQVLPRLLPSHLGYFLRRRIRREFTSFWFDSMKTGECTARIVHDKSISWFNSSASNDGSLNYLFFDRGSRAFEASLKRRTKNVGNIDRIRSHSSDAS